MPADNKSCCSKWTIFLIVVFLFAMVMGPGPGLLLINPAEGETQPATLLGMPIVYAWSLIWFAVQAAVVVTAYVTIWSKEGD